MAKTFEEFIATVNEWEPVEPKLTVKNPKTLAFAIAQAVFGQTTDTAPNTTELTATWRGRVQARMTRGEFEAKVEKLIRRARMLTKEAGRG